MSVLGAVAVPGETLFSLGRHLLALDADDVYGHLSNLGAVMGGPLLHSVAMPIERFCAHTQQRYGTADELLRSRTTFDYYSTACSTKVCERLKQRLLTGNGPRYAVPRLRSPVLLERTPDMNCPECAALIAELFGRQATLLMHVCPLEEVCPIHGLPLEPGGSKSRAWVFKGNASAHRLAKRFAVLSCSLLNGARADAPSDSPVRANILHLLNESPFLTSEHEFLAAEFEAEYLRFFESSPLDRRLKTLAQVPHRARRSLYGCISPESSQHPVLQIMLALFLEAVLAEANPALSSLRERKLPGKGREYAKPRGGAAKSPAGSGESRASRRERTHGGKRIVELLERDLTPKKVAQRLGIPVDAVYFFIRKHGLWEGIRKKKFAMRRELLRQQWQGLVDANPEQGITALRRLSPGVYKWLSRNDKVWLTARRPAAPKGVWPGKTHPRPYGQDFVTARRLHEVGAALRQAIPPVRCTSAKLKQALGVTEYTFNDALRWKRVSRAFNAEVESSRQFKERIAFIRKRP